MVKRLIFFSTAYEVDRYLRRLPIGRDDLVISMSPRVLAYLKKKGIPVRDTTAYFTNDSHEKALKKSKELCDWLKERADLSSAHMGIVRAYTEAFVFWTRFAAHYFIWTAEIVSNAVAMHKPETLCASFGGSMPAASRTIEPEENHLGYIVKSVSEAGHIRFEDTGHKKEGSPIFPKRVKNYWRALALFIFRYERFKVWQRLFTARALFTKKRPVFFTSPHYQMGRLAARLKETMPDNQFYIFRSAVVPSFRISERMIRTFWPRSSKEIISRKRLMGELEDGVVRERRVFSYNGISFAKPLAKKIHDGIEPHIIGLMLWTVRLMRFIDSVRPAALVANGTRSDDVILAELCRRKNIPALLISHGSHVGPKNGYEMIEWGEHGTALLKGPFSLIALQTPLSEGYLAAFPPEASVVRTGPLIWGCPVDRSKGAPAFNRIFRGRFDRKRVKVVVHAGTPKRIKALRFYVYETPDEYIGAIIDLKKAVEKMADVVLIVKFRPSDEISADDIRTLVGFSDKAVLSVDEPFTDVLAASDLLVSFASTTIEEALQNSIPALLYGGNGRYQHTASYEITAGADVAPRAVYHVKDRRDLGYGIQAILGARREIAENQKVFDPYVYAGAARESLDNILKRGLEKV